MKKLVVLVFVALVANLSFSQTNSLSGKKENLIAERLFLGGERCTKHSTLPIAVYALSSTDNCEFYNDVSYSEIFSAVNPNLEKLVIEADDVLEYLAFVSGLISKDDQKHPMASYLFLTKFKNEYVVKKISCWREVSSGDKSKQSQAFFVESISSEDVRCEFRKLSDVNNYDLFYHPVIIVPSQH